MASFRRIVPLLHRQLMQRIDQSVKGATGIMIPEINPSQYYVGNVLSAGVGNQQSSQLFPGTRRFSTTRQLSSSSDDEVLDPKRPIYSLLPQGLQNPEYAVVVRNLPQKTNITQLANSLSKHLNTKSDKVTVFPNIFGTPAFAVVFFESAEQAREGLNYNKSRLDGSKLYVKVIYIQSLADFMEENGPVKSGHDSRKLVVFNINQYAPESDILDYIKQSGHIMNAYFPKNFDKNPLEGYQIEPPQFKYFKYYPREKDTHDNTNYLADARHSVMKQLKDIEFRVQTVNTSSAAKTAYEDLYDAWMLVREIKHWLKIKPCDEEIQIDKAFNELQRKRISVEEALLQEIELLSRIRSHVKSQIDYFFPTAGYGFITMSTRKEAERLIARNYLDLLPEDYTTVCAGFDRGLPGWYYHPDLLESALNDIRKGEHVNTQTISANKAQIIIKQKQSEWDHIINRFTKGKKFYYGSDDMEDPVVSGKVFDYDESQYLKEGFEADVNQMFNKRQALLQGVKRDDRYYIFSSDEDYYDSENEPADSLEKVQGRLKNDDTFAPFIEKKIFQRIQTLEQDANESIHDPQRRPSDFKVPQTIYSSKSEKMEGELKLKRIQKFFHEALPDEVIKNTQHLQKQKFGDYPNERFVFKLPFNYKSLPDSLPIETKRQQILEEMRIFKDQVMGNNAPEDLLSAYDNVRFGEEEQYIMLNRKQFEYITDSDKESELLASEEYQIAQQERREREQLVNSYKFFDPDYRDEIRKRVSFPEKTVIRNYIYSGDDIQQHLEQQRKEYPDLEFWYEQDSVGIKHVIVKYQMKITYKLDVYEKLEQKYNISKIDDISELEIDEEDEELINEYLSWPDDPDQMRKEFYIQEEARKVRNVDQDFVDLEEVKIWKSFFDLRKLYDSPEKDYFKNRLEQQQTYWYSRYILFKI